MDELMTLAFKVIGRKILDSIVGAGTSIVDRSLMRFISNAWNVYPTWRIRSGPSNVPQFASLYVGDLHPDVTEAFCWCQQCSMREDGKLDGNLVKLELSWIAYQTLAIPLARPGPEMSDVRLLTATRDVFSRSKNPSRRPIDSTYKATTTKPPIFTKTRQGSTNFLIWWVAAGHALWDLQCSWPCGLHPSLLGTEW